VARGDPQINVRLPEDAKSFVEREAKANGSSRTSEIVRAIRERMKAKGPAEAPTSPDRDQNHPPIIVGGVDVRI
jgi:hypothetical protein